MGLDFSCETPFKNAPCWSCGGFNRFRTKIAKSIGIDLKQMRGFGGIIEWDYNHSLTPFLDHSDCDGILTVKEMKIVYPALSDAILKIRDNSTDYDYDFINGMQLVFMMKHCILYNEDLIFC
jgi:hypothetical protein